MVMKLPFVDHRSNCWPCQNCLFYLVPHCFHCWAQILIFSLFCLQYCSHFKYKVSFTLQWKSINSPTHNTHNCQTCVLPQSLLKQKLVIFWKPLTSNLLISLLVKSHWQWKWWRSKYFFYCHTLVIFTIQMHTKIHLSY